MKTFACKQINNEILNIIDNVDKSEDMPVLINSKGQRFVILKEEEYHAWRETAYLLSSSKNAELLQEAIKQPSDKCKDLKSVLDELDS